jgi:propanol-preferring alcohol dehydrogenase
MRALVLERPGDLERMPGPLAVRDVPAPSAGPGEILVRVAACAVCRTDLQLVAGDLAARRLPTVPGHQVVGRVEAVGPGVAGWSIGDRAAAGWLAGACGACPACHAERENLCESARFTGWDRDGGFAELVVLDAAYALEVPEGFDDLAAAPLLCGGVIGYRSLLVSGIRPGGHLGLYGFGASASLAIQVATSWGCTVHVATRSERERARALRLGAASVGGYDDPPPAPLDAAVTFAPAGAVVVAALRALGRGGTVAINAIHLDGIPAFPYDALWWERGLRSVANFTRRDARELLELASSIPIRTEIEVLPLESGAEALARLAAGTLEATAVLVP